MCHRPGSPAVQFGPPQPAQPAADARSLSLGRCRRAAGSDRGRSVVSIDPGPAFAFIDGAAAIIERIRTTQMEQIVAAAEICANSIDADGLVHLFGTGHSRIPVEEIFP